MKFVESINKSLHDLLENDKEIVLFGEDIIDPYGGAFKVTKGLSTIFPDRVLPTPISEAAIIGIAGGMAIGGVRPIVEIMFGDFMLLAADQLLNHLVKYEWMYNNKISAPVVIRTAMGGRRGYGPTHSQSIEPILSTIPGIKIISPSIYHNPGKLLEHSTLNENGTKVFCEYKMNYPKTLVNNKNCKDGISVKNSNGDYPTTYLSNSEFDDPEILIISHGGNAILIEELLLELLIEYELIVQANLPSLIKPVLFEDLLKGIDRCKIIIVIEESPKNFGWGSEIVAQLAERRLIENKSIYRVGADESPIPSSIFLEQKVLPNINEIIGLIKSTGII